MEDDLAPLADGDGVSMHAGFPNPAADKKHGALSLDRLLIKHPSSTYLFRIRGSSHEAAGIFDGDLALIDRAISPRSSDLVIAWQSDSFHLCSLSQLPEGIEPWGTITSIIHNRA